METVCLTLVFEREYTVRSIDVICRLYTPVDQKGGLPKEEVQERHGNGHSRFYRSGELKKSIFLLTSGMMLRERSILSNRPRVIFKF